MWHVEAQSGVPAPAPPYLRSPPIPISTHPGDVGSPLIAYSELFGNSASSTYLQEIAEPALMVSTQSVRHRRAEDGGVRLAGGIPGEGIANLHEGIERGANDPLSPHIDAKSIGTRGSDVTLPPVYREYQ